MSTRSTPQPIKVYEALGTIGDERLQIGTSEPHGVVLATVTSSSGNKVYTVQYDSSQHAIMANDNGSYWVGHLGYPSIAVLMKLGVLPYHETYAQALAGIHRKQINTDFKNDFEQTTQWVKKSISDQGVDLEQFDGYVESVLACIEDKPYGYLGKKVRPPSGW